MAKKCVYCGAEISEDSAIDVCDRCGVQVWGQKMFQAIKTQMNDAMTKGDLCSTNMNFNQEFKGNNFKRL